VEIWERRHLVMTLVVVAVIGVFVLLMGVGVIDAQGAPPPPDSRPSSPKARGIHHMRGIARTIGRPASALGVPT